MTEEKEKQPVNFHKTLRAIIEKFSNEKVKESALRNLEVLESKGITMDGKPSACAGGLLYFSRGNEKIKQVEIVRFLRSELFNPRFEATEVTIRRVAKNFVRMKYNGVFTSNQPQPNPNAGSS